MVKLWVFLRVFGQYLFIFEMKACPSYPKKAEMGQQKPEKRIWECEIEWQHRVRRTDIQRQVCGWL